MPNFSSRSKQRLKSCHPNLQIIFNEVIKTYDCTILEGYRDDERQNELFFSGKSTKKAGQSKHNQSPSLAIDVAPYHKDKPHIDWDCIENFYLSAGYVLAISNKLNIKIRWGGSWDLSLDVRRNKFKDLPHFELL